MLIGPPGVGKSTWRAKHLETVDRKTTVVSGDDLIDAFALGRGMTYTEAFGEIDHKWVKQEVRRLFIEALGRGENVIVDRTNMTVKSRRSFLSNVPASYQKIAVVFELPRDILNERLQHRAETTGKYIPTSVVDGMLAQYQPPADGEFHEVRTNYE